jgi:hypothetical protein
MLRTAGSPFGLGDFLLNDYAPLPFPASSEREKIGFHQLNSASAGHCQAER